MIIPSGVLLVRQVDTKLSGTSVWLVISLVKIKDLCALLSKTKQQETGEQQPGVSVEIVWRTFAAGKKDTLVVLVREEKP